MIRFRHVSSKYSSKHCYTQIQFAARSINQSSSLFKWFQRFIYTTATHLQNNKSNASTRGTNMPTQAQGSTNVMEESILGDTTLQPGQEKSIVLGLYEKDFPHPELEVDINPQGSIAAELEKANDDSGEYRLTYRFRNTLEVPCLVTVRQLG